MLTAAPSGPPPSVPMFSGSADHGSMKVHRKERSAVHAHGMRDPPTHQADMGQRRPPTGPWIGATRTDLRRSPLSLLSSLRSPPQLSLEVGVVRRCSWATEVLPGPAQNRHSHREKEPTAYALASVSRYQMDKANHRERHRTNEHRCDNGEVLDPYRFAKSEPSYCFTALLGSHLVPCGQRIVMSSSRQAARR